LHLNEVKAHADEHDLVRTLDRACRQVDIGQAALLKWLLALVHHLIGDRGISLTALVRGKYLLAEAYAARLTGGGKWRSRADSRKRCRGFRRADVGG
jgi:hypothetical protein